MYCSDILDLFSVHKEQSFLDLLKRHKISVIFIPGGMTGTLQPGDLSLNRPFKAKIREKFSDWYFGLSETERAGASSMHVLKHNVLLWIAAACEHNLQHPIEHIIAGWQ
ncbi:MAG TPA: hypothetical protein VKE92_16525, partial [Anaerolineales bacterium]|nr:hypothetical protein [Anaerolineales bacterium]